LWSPMLLFTNNRVRFGVMTRVSDCAFNFIAYDLVKTKLLEHSVESRNSVLGGPEDEPCDWFILPLRTAYDSDNLGPAGALAGPLLIPANG